MDHTPDPAADHDGERPLEARHHDVEVRVRRTPKYGVFMAIGAAVGAVAAWIIGILMPPGVNVQGQAVDTMPVVGLAVVGGFVVGAGLGGLVAVLVDRSLSKRGTTLVAEQLDVRESEPPVAPAPIADASSLEAAFEPIDDGAAGPQTAEASGPAQQERDRLGEA